MYVREAQQISAKLLGGLMRFPLGITMVAEHVMENGTHYDPDELAYWDENVTLMVDMKPDFLRHDVFYDPDQDKWINPKKIVKIQIYHSSRQESDRTGVQRGEIIH
jgi:hypothetical protein